MKRFVRFYSRQQQSIVANFPRHVIHFHAFKQQNYSVDTVVMVRLNEAVTNQQQNSLPFPPSQREVGTWNE